jgi:hypothetical protein
MSPLEAVHHFPARMRDPPGAARRGRGTAILPFAEPLQRAPRAAPAGFRPAAVNCPRRTSTVLPELSEKDAAGPIAAIYLLAQHLPRQAFIGTSVIFFFIINTVKLIPYSLLGLIDTSTLWIGLWLLPLIPVGTFLGARLNRVMSENMFRVVIFVIVVLTGARMVWG